MVKRKKNGILKLDSDHDFLKAFETEQPPAGNRPVPGEPESLKSQKTNRHGVRILENSSGTGNGAETEADFQTLLEASFARKPEKSRNRNPGAVPLKKRIKRYPPVEKSLDLHGCTALKARFLARSFIQTCKEQGFFTIRLIVGKGRHSETGPVLPDVIEDLAAELKGTGQVLWFEWEKKTKKSSGALIVYLKQFDQYD